MRFPDQRMSNYLKPNDSSEKLILTALEFEQYLEKALKDKNAPRDFGRQRVLIDYADSHTVCVGALDLSGFKDRAFIFSEQILQQARFTRTILRGAVFFEADLDWSTFYECDLRGVNLENIRAEGARFVRCIATKGDFERWKAVREAHFIDTVFEEPLPEMPLTHVLPLTGESTPASVQDKTFEETHGLQDATGWRSGQPDPGGDKSEPVLDDLRLGAPNDRPQKPLIGL